MYMFILSMFLDDRECNQKFAPYLQHLWQLAIFLQLLLFIFVDCQRAIDVSQAGVLTSPGYPNNYADNLNCRYTFYAQPGYRVNLTFTAFSVEDCGGLSCTCDVVTVSRCSSST